MDIISTLTQIVQTSGVILILAGMLVAFLWKIAAVINAIVGIVVTVVVAYAIFSFTGDFWATLVVFFIGLVITYVLVLLGIILCFIEALVLSGLGFWAVLAANNVSSAVSSQNAVISVVASLVSTGVAFYLGDKVFSAPDSSKEKKSGSKIFDVSPVTERLHGNKEKQNPITVEVLPENGLTAKPGANQISTVMEVSDQDYFAEKKKLQKAREKLQKETVSHKIDQKTSERLRVELEEKLRSLDNVFANGLRREVDGLARELSVNEQEIAKFKKDMGGFDEERKVIAADLGDLEARFKIRIISRTEFVQKQKVLRQKQNSVDFRASIAQNSIQKLNIRMVQIRKRLEERNKTLADTTTQPV